MKILHVINNLGSGGAEKLLTDILPLMKQRGHDVTLCIANGKKNVVKYEKILLDNDISIIDYKTSYYSPVLIIRLCKTVKKGDFDIIHAHLFPTQYWLAFASLFFSKKNRLVKTEHSVHNERKQYKILRPLERFVYGRYHKLIGITKLVKENLANWLDTHNIVIINNGVNLNQIKEATHKQKTQSNTLLDKYSYNILMTGRFDGWQKDQKSLIDAVTILDQNIKLYFAGEGSYMKVLKEYVKSKKVKNDIHFLGMRTDIYYLMANVDLNVLSTNHEGLSGVTLESLASGKPFLGTDVVGVKDVVPDKSFLFPKENPEALAEKIKLVKDDVEFSKTLVEKALLHVKKYDISNMVDGYLDTYSRTLL